ncbi:GNAT family N-acetyltransferase [Burkholderia glumae]|uniref:GNAT family N-acetyltransferase n=1 Tax=Burkholderia glumae TaxID=337 RepID=A0AAP9XW89_BURGL|nr:GNAT family protein [Burkholderia glumae]ACR32291.1 GCN5-like N-acetyltransferase [Burkholderia glumae BGR1]AJY64753.1 acetyltransferase family protein [Burkholderia glumae LMG 2196 = ATCC 33617]KHJ62863.1 GCN5 family acetyltransferase [Burkholderia glumae]MCM2484518.1 GNAT family N-acetyltransferase [Burkholderia glumae]MCM2494886.1 GNAT family N-acetyltransferase [Burkholderia glumae]
MEQIETSRLILRNFEQRDALDLWSYLREPRASCYLSMKLEDENAAKIEAIRRSKSDEYIAVCLKAPDKLIGDLFFMQEDDTFSVGWNFNAAFSGRGFAFEAAHALFDYLFAAKQARRLYAYVEEENLASRRLCERLGMRKEGVFMEFISFKNDSNGNPVFENTMQYAILKKEWSNSEWQTGSFDR